VFLRFPCHLEGVLETSSGRQLPFTLDASDWFHDPESGMTFCLVTCPVINWVARPFSPYGTGLALDAFLYRWRGRLWDKDGKEINPRAMLSAFNEDADDKQVYVRDLGLEQMFEDKEDFLGRPYLGGFTKAWQASKVLAAKQGSPKRVDGWYVWGDAP